MRRKTVFVDVERTKKSTTDSNGIKVELIVKAERLKKTLERKRFEMRCLDTERV